MSKRFWPHTAAGGDITLTRLICLLGAVLCAAVLACVTFSRPLSDIGFSRLFSRLFSPSGVSVTYRPITQTASEPSLVNINSAGIDELTTLPGIGESTAEAIIKYRNEIGFFKSVDELLEVSGIGEKKLAGLEGRVRVEREETE